MIVQTARAFLFEQLEEREMLSWGGAAQLMHLDGERLHAPAIAGQGSVIVDLDSGLNVNHPVFAGRLWTNPGEIAGDGKDNDGDGLVDDVHGWNFVSNNSNIVDDQGHGTMTAAAMVANHFVNTGDSRGYSGDGREYQGVAAGAKVLPLKVVDRTGNVDAYKLDSALKWIIANHARYNIQAVNMSLDVGSRGWGIIAGEVQSLWNAGVFIAAASGNGYNANNVLAWPAMSGFTASVGAENGDGSVASVTSRGAGLELLAPGNQIPYPSLSGSSFELGQAATSYATPFVTATAALIKQVNPKFSSRQVLSILQDSGTPVYDPSTRLTYKAINVDAAVNLAFARSAPAPAAKAAPVAAKPPVKKKPVQKAKAKVKKKAKKKAAAPAKKVAVKLFSTCLIDSNLQRIF
jgi:subtilisin family serine protease